MRPIPITREVRAKATIGGVMMLSAALAAALAAARPSEPPPEQLQPLQGAWVSRRDGVDENPVVTGNVVRWNSGRIDVIEKRLWAPQKLTLNGWTFDVDIGSQQTSSTSDVITWTKGPDNLVWTRDRRREGENDGMMGEMSGEMSGEQQARGSGDLERQWERGEIAMTPFKHIPSVATAKTAGTADFMVDVGVSPCSPRRFRFSRILPQPPLAAQPSRILRVEIPRPVGIAFEMDRNSGHVVVAEILPNGNADKQRKLGAFTGSGPMETVRVGDVLRAFSTTTFEYGTLGLLGAEAPKKSRTLFGVPSGTKSGAAVTWSDIASALKQDQLHGSGEVTMILERRMAPEGTEGADGYN
uniref:PDZ domain-containing protein n=1 Tax=Lotharella globosa TaxID=91324 RepID=A0A7S4DW27_9EUKA